MRILSLPLGADTGGVSISLKRAFDHHSDWDFRSMVSTVNYIEYQSDLTWNPRTLAHFWRKADLIHLHHSMIGAVLLTRGWKGIRLPQRSFVVHFHGTGFREDPKKHIAELQQWRATGLVATLDLWLLARNVTTWLPCPVDVEAMQARRTPIEDDVIRICHAPTNREIKSTDEVIAAVETLQAEGLNVELDLIEGVSWDTCLERKAKADIYVDQVILGYGNNAIEAWGMGIPVIAGAQPATLQEMERRFGVLPFYLAAEGTIVDAIRALVLSPALRREYSDRGLGHVRRFHDERVVVEQLKAIYLRAAGMRTEDAA